MEGVNPRGRSTSAAVCLASPPTSPLACEHRWRFICCLYPPSTRSHLQTHTHVHAHSRAHLPTHTHTRALARLLSGVGLPAEALHLTVGLSDSLSFSCGRRPPSAAVTANRPSRGSVPSRDLDAQLSRQCSYRHSFTHSGMVSSFLQLQPMHGISRSV